MDVCKSIWAEYVLIYAAYEDFNGHFLTLKGWSVSVSLAAIIAVYSKKLGSSGKVVLWIAALSSIPFWILDTLWKSYQKAYLARLIDLEAIENCAAVNSHKLGFIAAWDKAWKEFGMCDWAGCIANSAFPHAFVLLIGVFLVLKFPPQQSRETKPA